MQNTHLSSNVNKTQVISKQTKSHNVATYLMIYGCSYTLICSLHYTYIVNLTPVCSLRLWNANYYDSQYIVKHIL